MLGTLQQRLLHRSSIPLLLKRSFAIQARKVIPYSDYKRRSFSNITVFASHHRCSPADGLGFKTSLHPLGLRQDFSTNPKSQSGRELQPELEHIPVPHTASKNSDVFTLPTLLTLSRVAAVPVLLSGAHHHPALHICLNTSGNLTLVSTLFVCDSLLCLPRLCDSRFCGRLCH